VGRITLQETSNWGLISLGIIISVVSYFFGKGIEVFANKVFGIGWTYRNINSTIINVARKSQCMNIFGGSLEWAENEKVLAALEKRVRAGKTTRILYQINDHNRRLVQSRLEKLKNLGLEDNQLNQYDLNFEGVGADSVWWYKPRKTVFTRLGRIRESKFRMNYDETVYKLLDDLFQNLFQSKTSCKGGKDA
jgi:hypothetical protein